MKLTTLLRKDGTLTLTIGDTEIDVQDAQAFLIDLGQQYVVTLKQGVDTAQEHDAELR